MERNEVLSLAHAAFERGRTRLAARTLLFTVPMVALSTSCCARLPLHLALGAALVAAGAWLAWRGGVGGRALPVGLAAGVVPMWLPSLARASCSMTGGCGEGLPACVAGGLVAGALIAWRSAKMTDGRRDYVLAAGGIASLAGAMGCVILGIGGVAAMIVALVALSGPAILVPRGGAS